MAKSEEKKETNGALTPEEEFARLYIKKSRRERLLHELTDPRKRYSGLDRFCHQSGELIDRGKLLMEGDGLERSPGFLAFAKAHGGLCRILSPDSFIDGLELPLGEAMDLAARSFDAVIILGDGFAIVFGESVQGGREKYLLQSKAPG